MSLHDSARAWLLNSLAMVAGLLVTIGAGCGGQVGTNSVGESAAAYTYKCSDHGSVLHGIDVSSYQGTNVDWGAVKSSGISFAFAKATEGTGVIDLAFANNWPRMRSAGVVRGAYVFFHPSVDPVAQVNLLVDTINKNGGLQAGDLPPMLDVEVADNLSAGAVVSAVKAAVAQVQARTGRLPVMYTGLNFWQNVIGNPTINVPLFIADYDGVACPYIPTSFSTWTFWQYTDAVTVGGISGGVDGDEFNGTLADLQSFANGAPSPPPPPPPAGPPGKCPAWGWYCGQAGFGGDPSHLYYCPKTSTTAIDLGQCGDGVCHVAAAGHPDYCDGGASMAGGVNYSGYGWWCGGAGTPMGDGKAGHLYFFDDNFATDLGACAGGCSVNPGAADSCNQNKTEYQLPWTCGETHATTQGNFGDICGSTGGDHTGTQEYAFDFALPRDTAVRAVHDGTVAVAASLVGPGQPCYEGCTQPFGTSQFWACCNTCINRSNHVNLTHGDGTVSTYWHLDRLAVVSGQVVRQGDIVGYSGTSGCSSGPHLHMQVMGNCPTGYCQSVPTSFQGSGVPACGQNVTSQNACGH